MARPAARPAAPGLRPWCAPAALCALLLLIPAALASPLRPAGPPHPADLHDPLGRLHRPTGDDSWRLPGDAHPLHYDLHIAPDLDQLSFEASVDITLQVDKPIVTGHMLTLHADGSLKFKKCTLDDNEVQHTPSRDGKDFIHFMVMKEDLSAKSQHKLHCEYEGKIFEDDKGFYLSEYKLKSGLDAVPVKIGVTQFEMTFARRALPCFDEPGYRASVSLAITHLVQQSAISNTRPDVIVSVNTTHVKTTFERTPAMAVYTLAWLVSQMPNVSSADGTFHTYAQPKYIDNTELSQSVGPQVLALMGEYTGIPYALDKMDQAALPDFNFGAMENWGLVTYRQALLLSGADSRATTNLSVTTTIAHELAHQWFGNLVTPSWWGHVWLSEAFAELFCYLMTDKINPDWKVLEKMPLMEMHDAFVEDALLSAAAMTNEAIYTPSEILDNFGSITYAKGSSVLRMLMDAMDSVSAGSFQRGLQNYLKTKQDSGVVEPADLWTALETQGVSFPDGLSVTQLGKQWTEQAGYPIVTVTRNGDSVTVTQERFLSSGDKADPQATWPVPLTWRAQGAASGAVHRQFLTKASDSVSGVPKDAAWVLFNVDQLGYYRVNYDADGWKALASALASDPDALTAPEKAMLVDDALALARAGRLEYDAALSLLEYLTGEREYAPWAALAASIELLALQCRAAGEQDQVARDFNKWLADLTKKAYDDLGFASSAADSFERKLARSVVAQVAYEASLSLAVNDASLSYLNHDNMDEPLDPDTARLALCKGLADSHTDAVYKDFVRKLNYSTDEMERRDYTYALGCAPQNAEVQLKTELLKLLTSTEADGLDKKDVKALWKSLLSTELGLGTALNYVVDNAQTILDGRGESEMTTILTNLAARIATEDDENKLSEIKITSIQDVVKECLRTVDANLVWRKKNLAAVSRYLEDESDKTTTTGGPTTPPQPTTPPPPPTPPPAAYRLPTSVIPVSYKLALNVLGFDTFDGSVSIMFMALDEGVTSVVMHASGLNISTVRVYETYGSDVDVTSTIVSPEVEQISINLAKALQPGNDYSVDIKYTGPVRSDFTGLYHTLIGGRDMIGTHMYPAYARRVLPCFDEPHLRAPFSLSVLHDQALVAVGSEKSPLRRGLRDAIVQDDFDVTTAIPASQLGLFLVDYRELKTLETDGITVCGRQELIDAAKSTGLVGQAQGLLAWYANATGAPTAPAQLNLLGVSNSFEDAVSSWGVVAIRERDLVNMDSSPSSGASEQAWLTHLARSLSQIWFGGQVSADWWDSAWIREGFATFFEYSVPATLQPRWQLPYQLYTRAIAPALHADSFESAHALRADVSGSQDTIANALDALASGKGGAVVQMLSHVLEENGAFDTGLQLVFNDGSKLPHTIKTDDLFTAMEKAATKVNADTKLPDGVSLKDALSSWVDVSGYPVINVIRDYNAKTATISQERFLVHRPSSPQSQSAWWAPLSYALRAEYLSIDYTPKVPLKTWLRPDQPLTVDLADNDDWLLVNADRREFFRVNYDVKNWKKLEEFLREYPTLLETVARAMLVDDALALSRSGRLDYPVALEFLDYLRYDADLAPWEAARLGFQHLDAQLLGSQHEAVYKTWLLQLLEHAVEEAGFVPEERDTHTQRLTRSVVTTWACDLGHDSCTRYAKRDFDTWLEDPDAVGHDTLGAAVCVGLRQGDADTRKTVVAKLQAEEDDALRAAIISGLGCGGNVHALFDLTVRPGLRRGEPALLWGSATRFGHKDLTQSLHCFTNMHRRVAARYGKDSIVEIAKVLADRVTTEDQLPLLAALVQDIDAARLQGALLLAQDNVAWREDNLDAVADVLYALTNTPDPDLPTTTAAPTTTPGTVPPGPTVTDPATATDKTTASVWTLPPSAATTGATLPTLHPDTIPTGASPTDPATASTATTATPWTEPASRPTTPVTMPTIPTGPSTSTTPTAGTPVTGRTPPTPVPVPSSTPKPNSAGGLAASMVLVLAALVALVFNKP